MPNETSISAEDGISPSLRKVLIEVGALIPTTPQEVEIAEARLNSDLPAEVVSAAFAKLEQMIDDESPSTPFMSFREPIIISEECGLAMAARNGAALDPETLQRIEESVAQALLQPPRE